MDKRNTEPTLEINSAQKGDKSENAAGFGKMGSIDQAGTLNENTCTHHEQSQSGNMYLFTHTPHIIKIIVLRRQNSLGDIITIFNRDYIWNIRS